MLLPISDLVWRDFADHLPGHLVFPVWRGTLSPALRIDLATEGGNAPMPALALLTSPPWEWGASSGEVVFLSDDVFTGAMPGFDISTGVEVDLGSSGNMGDKPAQAGMMEIANLGPRFVVRARNALLGWQKLVDVTTWTEAAAETSATPPPFFHKWAAVVRLDAGRTFRVEVDVPRSDPSHAGY